MRAAFHFLRPEWLVAMFPLLVMIYIAFRRSLPLKESWSAICEPHLLSYLLETKKGGRARTIPWFLVLAVFLMIVALAGPTWTRLPVPTYKKIQPLVILLDMSEKMSATDVTPSRLQRAKFILHDIFQQAKSGQVGMVVYSGEPFVVSPLTEDAQTIDALLPALTLDVMPVGGHALDNALKKARELLKQAGFNEGKIMILTPNLPSLYALKQVDKLRQQAIYTSIIPVRKTKDGANNEEAFFQKLADTGGGKVFSLDASAADIMKWSQSEDSAAHFVKNAADQIPHWRDEGRWFLWPALFCLLPVFRRGFLS